MVNPLSPPDDGAWASVVIAAHNEAEVIGRTLDALLGAEGAGQLEVVVVPNGCTDDTAAVARRREVRVIEVVAPGKAAALNAGEAALTTFPRAFLDADIIIENAGLRTLVSRLQDSDALVAIPDRELVLTGRPWPVRAYYAINRRLPAFQQGLFGRGLIVMTDQGRKRFGTFPPVVADDMFLDSLFDDSDRLLVREVRVGVQTPLTTRALIRRLERVRRGAASVRRETRGQGGRWRPSDRLAWLRDVVLPHPHLAPAAVVYVVITITAALRALRKRPNVLSWDPDDSRRRSDADLGRGPATP